MSDIVDGDAHRPRTPSIRIAVTCILLGLICLAFPFVAHWIDPTLFGRNIYLLSASMAFGLFLAAVGGYATGSWGGWTFGGAAATVVALFLLILSTGEETGSGTEVIARLQGNDLYKDFQIVEVEDLDGKRLFTAPNRTLNYANILIEEENLGTDCLTFLFLPRPGAAAGGADVELIDMRVPSRVFTDELAIGQKNREARRNLTLTFDKGSGTIFRHAEDGNRLPLTGPGLCGTALFNVAAHAPAGSGWSWDILSAHAADGVPPELLERLRADDPLLRRDARAQLAALGPDAVEATFAAIPAPDHPDFYRLALGASMALASMLAETDAQTRQAADDALSDEALGRLVSLLAHDDETMRKWSTAAVVRLASPRSIAPLVALLGDDKASLSGRYNAAFSLAEIAPSVSAADRSAIASGIAPILPSLGPRTRALLDGVGTAPETADGAGWVFLGFQTKGDWAETNFKWDDNDALPEAGAEIVAQDRTSLRSEATRFDPATGWNEAEVSGVVEPGQSLTVRRVEEVAPGFYWAETQKSAAN